MTSRSSLATEKKGLGAHFTVRHEAPPSVA